MRHLRVSENGGGTYMSAETTVVNEVSGQLGAALGAKVKNRVFVDAETRHFTSPDLQSLPEIEDGLKID